LEIKSEDKNAISLRGGFFFTNNFAQRVNVDEKAKCSEVINRIEFTPNEIISGKVC
jgi:hypothetical protein